ncbi:unnamed protein product [Rotaria socialis]|uniref:Uncharacterized protein n=1 Tax=Rotaria socialis TaxID=392032 RepID=A0A818EY28_9BILA|nr:unnamed protein product [Rotaria socialis]CAF3465805.1 unnamed protein product [Rotaria socialis]CAF3638200.1 unnamed protein product [Rotaria socialis]CAF4124356.1 unnamed protein product [Rotaria socialis]CAF4256077.1 unnamed protein product [Rotaria socialis]
MSTKLFPLVFTLIILILLANIPHMVKAQYGLGTACKWVKGKTGWGCDDKISRAVWRKINGVKNCNDFCHERTGKRGGHCISNGNYDTSSWCPRGQTCQCY